MPEWWNGRHTALKMLYPKGCVSSSLTSGTIIFVKKVGVWYEKQKAYSLTKREISENSIAT